MTLPAYSSYLDSGERWLGDVPSHWSVSPLKHHFRIVGGSTPKSDVADYWNGDIPWVTPADLSKLDGWEVSGSIRAITQEGLASCSATLVPAGSVILSTRAPIGSLGVTTVAACTNQGCKALVPNGKMDARLLAFVLSTASEELQLRGKGTTFLEISGDELGRFAVPIPPFAEQIGILSFLNRETAKIDALVEEQRRLIQLLKEKRQAVISHAVTKGLNPAVPMKDSGVEWLGDVPAHWALKRAKHIFSQSALPVPDGADVVTCFRDGQVTLRRNRREDGFTMAVLEAGYQGIVPGQLVLHSMDAFAGAIGVSESTGKCSPEYVVCDVLNPRSSTQYYGRLLRMMALRGFISAFCPSVRERAPRIRYSNFVDLLLPIPPTEEQHQIVEWINVELDRLEALRVQIEASQALLREHRVALISAAVTGKIDVRDGVGRQAEAA